MCDILLPPGANPIVVIYIYIYIYIYVIQTVAISQYRMVIVTLKIFDSQFKRMI
jgi:hypothetical protein